MIYDPLVPPAVVPSITIELPLEGAVKITVNASPADRARLIDWVGHPRRLVALVNCALDATEAEQNAEGPPT